MLRGDRRRDSELGEETVRPRNLGSTDDVDHFDGTGTHTRAAAAAANRTNRATETRTTRTGLSRASVNVVNDLGGSSDWVVDRQREHRDVAGELVISAAPELERREVATGVNPHSQLHRQIIGKCLLRRPDNCREGRQRGDEALGARAEDTQALVRVASEERGASPEIMQCAIHVEINAFVRKGRRPWRAREEAEAGADGVACPRAGRVNTDARSDISEQTGDRSERLAEALGRNPSDARGRENFVQSVTQLPSFRKTIKPGVTTFLYK